MTAPPAVKSPSLWRYTAALRAELVGGAGTNVEPAPGMAFGMVLDRPGILAPSFEVSGTWATGAGIASPGRTGTLTLVNGALGACPVRFPIAYGLALRPCGEVALGALSGSGSGTNVVNTGTRVEPWVALAPMARAEWRIGKHFMVQVEAGPDIEIDRASFFWNRPQCLYKVPTVGSMTRLGATGVWP